MLLSAIHLCGVVKYSVARRRREIGVRTTLWAKPRDIWRLMAGQGITATGRSGRLYEDGAGAPGPGAPPSPC